MLDVVAFVAAAAVGYVLMRAAWIFAEWPGVVGLVLLVVALAVCGAAGGPSPQEPLRASHSALFH